MMSLLQSRLLVCFWLLALLSACASAGPVSSIKDIDGNSLINWPDHATQFDPECYNLHSKYDRWGVFVGCQAIDIFDVRTDNVFTLFQHNLSLQSCQTPLGQDGQRNYIRTGNHLLFIDKTAKNANAWFVPAGYYSDGVSTPNFVREILPGAILDTESPRTLSAALFHDRYFCLFEYTRLAWDPSRENYPVNFSELLEAGEDLPVAFRRRECTNTSFRNGLRTAGASSFISTVFTRMVSIVNPGKQGYCPRGVHGRALAQLDRQLEEMLGYGPVGTPGRTDLPGCQPKEPLILCLSRVEALWSLVATRADDYALNQPARISDEWRQVLMRVMCYELQARIFHSTWPYGRYFSREQAQNACGFVAMDALISENEDLRGVFSLQHDLYKDSSHPIESPFRAGDFLVEAAFMLTQEQGTEIFLEAVSRARNVDFAMMAIVYWNVKNTIQSN